MYGARRLYCTEYSTDFSMEQKGILLQMILAKKSARSASVSSTPPPPDSHDQEMLPPLGFAATDDAAQMLKNRENARAFERSQTSAPLLGSAMESAARSLSASGSLPPNAVALPHGAPPPPPPPSQPVRFLVPYLVAKVPPEIAFTFSREHNARIKMFSLRFQRLRGPSNLQLGARCVE